MNKLGLTLGILLFTIKITYGQNTKRICKNLSSKECAQAVVKNVLSKSFDPSLARCTKRSINQKNKDKFYEEDGEMCLKTGLYKNFFLFELSVEGKLGVATSSCKFNHIVNTVRDVLAKSKRIKPFIIGETPTAYKFGLPLILKYE